MSTIVCIQMLVNDVFFVHYLLTLDEELTYEYSIAITHETDTPVISFPITKKISSLSWKIEFYSQQFALENWI